MRWQIMRDACEGEDAVKEAGETYLHRPSDMPKDEYRCIYVDGAEYPGVMSHTLLAMRGRVFFNEPAVEGIDVADLDLLDTGGFTWSELTRWVVSEVLKVRRAALLVGGDATTPEISRYTAESLIDWKIERGVLLLAVLTEEYCELDDEGKEVTKTQCRRLELVDGRYEVAITRKTKEGDKEQWIEFERLTPTINGAALDYIPLVIIGDTTPPPLYALAKAALRFYKTSAGYGHSIHLAAHPTRFVKLTDEMYKGIEEKIDDEDSDATAFSQFYRFGTAFVNILPVDGEIGFAEISGTGLQLIENRLNAIRLDMAALGARSITAINRSNVAAETERMQQGAETAFLSDIGGNLTRSFTKALGFVAELRGLASDAYSVVFSDEFLGEKMTPEEVAALMNAHRSGAIPMAVVREELRARGFIRDEWNDDRIEEELENEAAGDLGMFGSAPDPVRGYQDGDEIPEGFTLVEPADGRAFLRRLPRN